MKRKGFTLVELLAVIAILAVLVVIAVPNVLRLFRNAKKNTFITEAKSIYQTAEKKWAQDSFRGRGDTIVYSKCDGCNTEGLNMSSRENLQYCVKMNHAGKIIRFNVSDGMFQYSYNGPGLTLDEIKEVIVIEEVNEDMLIDIPCDNDLLPGYQYASNYFRSIVGQGGLIEDEQGDLRYQGANVQNYVTFNNETAGWRIVGLFNVDGVDRIKLKKDASIGKILWDIGGSPASDVPVNQWGPSGNFPGSTLMNILNDQYYNGSTNEDCYPPGLYTAWTPAAKCNFPGLSSDAKRLIGDATWFLGAGTYGDTLAGQYAKERGNVGGKVCTPSDTCNDTVTRTTRWIGKVGLIYGSDFAYASGNAACKNNLGSSGKANCNQDNWLACSGSCNYWTITPYRNSTHSSYAFRVNPGSYIGNQGVSNTITHAHPTVYLVSDAQVKGSGTTGDPYVFAK